MILLLWGSALFMNRVQKPTYIYIYSKTLGPWPSCGEELQTWPEALSACPNNLEGKAEPPPSARPRRKQKQNQNQKTLYWLWKWDTLATNVSWHSPWMFLTLTMNVPDTHHGCSCPSYGPAWTPSASAGGESRTLWPCWRVESVQWLSCSSGRVPEAEEAGTCTEDLLGLGGSSPGSCWSWVSEILGQPEKSRLNKYILYYNIMTFLFLCVLSFLKIQSCILCVSTWCVLPLIQFILHKFTQLLNK